MEMSKFRKKPIVIEATQWWKNGDHPDDGDETYLDTGGFEHRCEGRVVRYFRHPDVPGDRECSQCVATMHVHGWIDTLEGGHTVCPGDWIITGVKGERYPCKPDIFAATYEPATSADEIDAEIEEWRSAFVDRLLSSEIAFAREGEDKRLPEWCYAAIGRATIMMRRSGGAP
jgi:hypothetical protein